VDEISCDFDAVCQSDVRIRVSLDSVSVAINVVALDPATRPGPARTLGSLGWRGKM